MRSLTTLLLLLAACGGSPTTPRSPVAEPAPAVAMGVAQGPEGAAPVGGRLPSDVTPLRYALELTILPESHQFGGRAHIEMRLEEARRVIYLHGRELEVNEVTVTPEGGEATTGQWSGQPSDDHFAAITLEHAVGPGLVSLDVVYTAPFGQHLGGLYRVDHAGHAYAFTQLQPLSARLMFPGFDEPGFKTPYDISVITRSDYEVVANSSETEVVELGGAMKRVRFATTAPLPTYLVALAVGPLDIVEVEPVPANTARSTPLSLRGVAPRGRGAELAYALQHTPAILAALETYFGTPYPFDKLDIVAVPDFEAGAMENVGLVTFRDTILLVDEERTTTRRLRYFAYIMAHELSHMWFGDLVTLAWWDDLWLNEAFASWMEHRAVAAWRPDYEADVELVRWVSGTMDQDSLASARQIRQPIEASHDIHNAFDSITYGKGAGVIGMFERWLGADTFRDGVRRHLAEHANANATSEDLLRAVGAVAGRDVATPLVTFLNQPGVPALAARLVCEGQGARVEYSQSRSLPVGSTAEVERSWQIPVCVRFGRGGAVEEVCELLTEAQGTLALPDGECPGWLMPNADGVGYYRWSLPAEQLEALIESGLEHLTVGERLSVADSVRAAFDGARTPAEDALSALATLAEDEHHAVATASLGLFEAALLEVASPGRRPALSRRLAGIFERRYRRLGWGPRRGRDEDESTRLLRTSIVTFMATVLEHPRAVREATHKGHAWLGIGRDHELHREAIPPDLVDAALTVTARTGEPMVFDAMMRHLGATSDGNLRRQLLRALGSFRQPALAARARELTLDESLRVSEVLTVLGRQMNEPETRDGAWLWLQEHLDATVARLPPSYAGWLPNVASSYCSDAHAGAVAAVFEDRVERLPGGPRNLAAATETIRLCAARVQAQRAGVDAWAVGRRGAR